MKKFMAIYLGAADGHMMEAWNDMPEAEKKAKEAEGMQAWMKWGTDNAASIADNGSPLGKTKHVDKNGVTDTRNAMAAWTIVQAENAEAAAKLFENHPHFMIFPGESVEIMECLPMPKME